MNFRHLLLVLLVILAWGINFIFVKLALDEIPPLLLCSLRFILASIPAIFFIKPPRVPFRIVVSYGLVMFVLQFSLFFLGMHAGMTPGMAPLIMQVQVFFSMFFAAIFLNEKPGFFQVIGACISFTGIGLVAFHFDQDVSSLGFGLIIAAAAAWGFGNLITKKSKNINMIALVVWASFVASVPLLGLTYYFEGPSLIISSCQKLSWKGIFAVAYIVYISTWVGYGVWNWLLSKYPVGQVVPFTLLIPIVGMLSSVFFLGEPLLLWKLVSGLLVLVGVGIHIVGPRIYSVQKRQIVNAA